MLSEVRGTDFQQRVWNELSAIPMGETRSYKEVAEAVGHPDSARAVANACSANPYAPEVPCHRVIRSDGQLGGYSGKGGVEGKRRLLLSEGAIQAQSPTSSMTVIRSLPDLSAPSSVK